MIRFSCRVRIKLTGQGGITRSVPLLVRGCLGDLDRRFERVIGGLVIREHPGNLGRQEHKVPRRLVSLLVFAPNTLAEVFSPVFGPQFVFFLTPLHKSLRSHFFHLSPLSLLLLSMMTCRLQWVKSLVRGRSPKPDCPPGRVHTQARKSGQFRLHVKRLCQRGRFRVRDWWTTGGSLRLSTPDHRLSTESQRSALCPTDRESLNSDSIAHRQLRPGGL